MAAEFSRLLTLLRKEKGISQKSAAQQLGVSQALLSHYENGIRECGLDFLVRAADFYGVSCDYILGRTPDRNGLTLTIEELPESDAAGKENSFRNGVQCTLNKKLITNSLNIIFDLLNRSGSRALVTEVSDFLMLAVYRAFRVLHGANEKNQPAMFKLNRLIAHPYSAAMMQVCQANTEQIAAGKPAEGMDPSPTRMPWLSPPNPSAGITRCSPPPCSILSPMPKSGCWPPMPPPTANNDPTLPSPATQRGNSFCSTAFRSRPATALSLCGLPSVARLVVPEKNFALLASVHHSTASLV